MIRKTENGWAIIKRDGTRLYIRGMVLFGLVVFTSLYLMAHVAIASCGR